MKCQLVQILAVAMILSQTVAMFIFYPAKLGHRLYSAMNEHVLGSSKLVESAENSAWRLPDILCTEINIIKQFSAINLVQVNSKTVRKMCYILDIFFDLRERLINSKHYNKVTMLNDVDNEIINIKTHLQKIEKDINIFIKNKEAESR